MSDLRAVIEKIDNLPTLPDIVVKLNRLITDPSTSAGDINDLISRDVSLSAKILKLVNSPYYGFPRRITTVTYAVVILGFTAVRNLTLSAFVFDAFKQRGVGKFDLKGFWRHSICTAVAAQHLARDGEDVSDEDGFMGGLLHDVGKVVMSQYLQDDLNRVMARVTESDCLFLDAEMDLLEYNHAKIGAILLEKWNLPKNLVAMVRHHHTPTRAQEGKRDCAIVHFADILARSLGVGSGGDRKMPLLDGAAWEELGLDWAAVDELLGQVRTEIKKVGAFLELTESGR